MKKRLMFFFCFVLLLILAPDPSGAGYLDECLTRILPMKDGTFIGAVQCNYFDFFIYLDKDGKPVKRQYVPQIRLEKLHLVDFTSDGKLYFIYQPEEGLPLFRGIVCDFSWNIASETGLEGMYKIIAANDRWWGISATEDGKPIIREVSFDGYRQVDHKLPDIKGVDYFKDIVSFTVDSKGDQILLFCKTLEGGFSGDGIIRRISDGKLVAQWIVDAPHVPESNVQIEWVGPITDKNGNIIVGHCETPCSAKNDDRVRVHKFGPKGSHIWTWGEKLYLVSDIKIADDGTIFILRPGGPIYMLSPDCKYKGQVIIEGISVLTEPECSQNKK